MGFSVKLMPGVRVRASSRGISTGIGPRVARVHVGTRGVGASTGVGPFGAYSRLGGSGRRGGGYRGPASSGYGGPTQRELAAERREAKLVELEGQIQEEQQQVTQLMTAHHQPFDAAARPLAPKAESVNVDAIRERLRYATEIPALEAELGGGQEPPQAPDADPVDRQALLGEYRKAALLEVPILHLSKRRRAKQEASKRAEAAAQVEEEKRGEERTRLQDSLDERWKLLQSMRGELELATEREAKAERLKRAAEQEKQQAELDAVWARLNSNDASAVINSLEEAFADNSAPAAAIDCEGSDVTVAVNFRGPGIVPERKPAVTPGGKPTMKKRTKGETNELYLEALASHILATVKEAFAVAPAINGVRVLVVREEETGKASGQLAAIYAGRFARTEIPHDKNDRDIDPRAAIEDAGEALLNLRGAAAAVSPLKLSDEPELQDALVQIAEGLDLPAAGI